MILKNTDLTKEEAEYIDVIKERFRYKAYYNVIEDIFKFIKNKYNTSRIAKIYGVSTRQIQLILKDIELNRTNRSKHMHIEDELNHNDKTNNKIRDKSEYQIKKESIIKNGVPQILFPTEVLEFELDNKIKKEIKEKLNVVSGISNPSPKQYSLEEIFCYIYIMLFTFNYTTGEVANCFRTRGIRTIQQWMIKMGWSLDKFQAQQRIVNRGKRDYKEIRNKSKETKLKEGIDIHESRPEEYTRKRLNYSFPQIFKDCEVIVGLNNISILDKGREVDIPVIIIKDDTLHKFAIEYNGSYWHQDKEREINKSMEIIKKGYVFFSIAIDDRKSYKQIIKQIDEEIEIIVAEMDIIINKLNNKTTI